MNAVCDVELDNGSVCKLGEYVEFDYFNMFLPDEVGYRHAFTAQVGLQVDVTEQCVLGFRLFNPSFTQIDYNDVARRLPVMMHVGCNYGFIDDLDLLVEKEKKKQKKLLTN